jgi:hypothetical protein
MDFRIRRLIGIALIACVLAADGVWVAYGQPMPGWPS